MTENDRPTVEVVHCPECVTKAEANSMEAAIEKADKHNETVHDGENVAKVNGIRPPEFSEEQKQAIQDAVARLKNAE